MYFATLAPSNWQRQFTGPMAALMTERVTDLNQTYNQRFPAVELLQQEWFRDYTITFAQPINATTEEAIRRLIDQATTEGWSIPTTQKHLGQMFQQWMTGNIPPEEFNWYSQRMPEYRRELISRTETIGGLNAVSFKLYGAWGVKTHQWLATHDARTRQDHREADGQVVAVGAPFDVGGWPLLYPGDKAGPPEQIINCRCVTIPVDFVG